MSDPRPAHRTSLGDQISAAQPDAGQDIADRLFEEARASAEEAEAGSVGRLRPADDGTEWSFHWTDAW